MEWSCLCYHLLVKSEGGDGVDHIDVPSMSCWTGFSDRRDCPFPAPEVRGQHRGVTKSLLKQSYELNPINVFKCRVDVLKCLNLKICCSKWIFGITDDTQKDNEWKYKCGFDATHQCVGPSLDWSLETGIRCDISPIEI